MEPGTDILRAKADQYAHEVYKLAVLLPKSELFGLTSQLRRAALSVPLNIIEGYARHSQKSEKQFLLISYGSLKESQYLLRFAIDEALLTEENALSAYQIGEEVARMLWKKTQTLANLLSK